jgi:RNA polymerase sigma-70 factor (ECF subfamily)
MAAEENRSVLANKDAILQELLILRCQRGDDRAFTELIRLWEKRLFFYIRRLVATEEDSWDVLQQTWLKVFQGIKSLEQPGTLATWLYKIARHVAMSHWRGHYREQAHFFEKAQQLQAAQDDGNQAFEDAEQVTAALSRISIDHREVLTLFFLEDLSLDEIADVLGIPQGTVKSRLRYAKRSLRAVLELEGANHA